MKQYTDKILTADRLVPVREQLKQEGKKVVQCHGCFDIVHPGHLRYLQFARNQGDILVVSISSDNVIDKGYNRPYINENLRAENLAALEFVDYVCIDDNTWAGPILEKLQPDIYVKGKEYETNSDPRFIKESDLVKKYGGSVIFSSGDVVLSSSYIINRFNEKFRLEQQKIDFFCQSQNISHKTIEPILKQFSEKNILVIGDPIIDTYVFCESPKVASESPILSVTETSRLDFIGAGGFIANQLEKLGASCTFLTTAPSSDFQGSMKQYFQGENIQCEVVETGKRPIFQKSRFLTDNKKLLKVDQGSHQPLTVSESEKLLEKVVHLTSQHDALILTDFGYGLFDETLIANIANIANNNNIPYFIDVSGSGISNLLKFKSPTVATPTESEIRAAYGDQQSGLSHIAARYFHDTQAEALILTMGDRGAIAFERPPKEGEHLKTHYLPSFQPNPFDTTGAGDALLATVALAMTITESLPISLYLGLCLAGHHISNLGNNPTTLFELETFIQERQELLQQAPPPQH